MKGSLFHRSIIALCFAAMMLSAHAQKSGPLNAVSCDGVNSNYVSVAANTWFNGDYTIEGWVYVRSYNNWSRLIDFGNGSNSGEVYFALSFGTGGQPVMGVLNAGGENTLLSPISVPTNQWVHLACTLSNTTGTIYINGVAVTNGSLSVPVNVVRTSNFIGRSEFINDAYANAVFDEVRIWNVAKTQSQIQANLHRSLVGNETNLVGYWRFDEGSGTTVADAAGLGHPGTLMNGPVWTNSAATIVSGMGGALNYTNNTQYCVVSNKAALNAYPLTIMSWFKATNGPGFALVSKYLSSSFNGYNLYVGGGGGLNGWYYKDSSDAVIMNAGAVADGNWHHAAMVIDNTGGRIYVDGVQKTTLPWTGTPGATTSNQDLYFNLYPGSFVGIGQQDEVSLWNTNLTQTQIRQYMTNSLAGNEPGLLGYWRFDEGSGSNTLDITGHGYNAKVVGNPSWIASAVPIASPDPGYALDSTGTNSEYVQVPNGVWFNGDFTVEGWVFVRSYNNWSRLFEFSDGPNTNDVFLALSGGVSGSPVMGIYTNNNGAPNFTGNAQLPTNQWVHLACTMSNTTGTIYINGTNVGSATLNIAPNVLRTNNYIGRSAYSVDAYANAIFDEVRIWNVARTPVQIQSNLRHTLTGTETNLIGYWRFDDGSSTNLVDATGNGNNATLVNGPTWVLSTNKLASPPVMGASPSAINITGTTATLIGSANPNGFSGAAFFEWGTTTNYGSVSSQTAFSAANILTNITNSISGLAPDTTYHFHFVVFNGGGLVTSADQVFATSNAAPSVTTLAAINPSTNGATLNATVNPDGLDTSYWFEWGTTASYGTSNAPVLLSATNTAVPVSSLIGNLLPGTPYNFRVVASNSLGTVVGSGLTVTTLGSKPTISAEFASDLNTNAATLNASVSPNYLTTVAWFEWGTDNSYGNTSDTFAVNETNNTTPVALSNAISGLSPGVQYHFHLVASNLLGEINGDDAAFTSLGARPTIGSEFPSGAATNSVTLNALVAPNYLATVAWFEWGADASYGNTSDLIPISETNGANQIDVTQFLNGLPPSVTNHFHLIASNLLGTAIGPDTLAATVGGLPQILLISANVFFPTNVNVGAEVNPNYFSTAGWFEISNKLTGGVSTNYFNNIGAGSTPQFFGLIISNLPPTNLFSCRAAATNAFGISYSAYQNFETYGPPLATTIGVTNISGNPALYGSMIANSPFAQAWFEYWTPGNFFTNTTFPLVSGGGFTTNLYSSVVGGGPGVFYNARAIASNSIGVSRGSIITYSTPGRPLLLLTNLDYTSSNITFHARVNPGAAVTGVYFEWGNGLTRSATAVVDPAGTNGFFLVNVTVPSTLPGFTYRAIATNVAGGLVTPFQLFASPSITLNGSDPAIVNCDASSVPGPAVTNSAYVLNIAGGTANGAALLYGGVAGWGALNPYTVPPALSNAVQVASGNNFACGITTNGLFTGWGFSTWSPQVSIPGLPLYISAKLSACAVISAANTVSYWGESPPLSSAIWNTPLPYTATSVAMGVSNLCILTDQGKIFFVGSSADRANIITNITGANQVACGYYHSLALSSNSVYAAGNNSFGQTNVPSVIQGKTIAIAAGQSHNLALLTNGTVVAWGNNSNGQTNVPADLTNVIAIAAGDLASYALKNNGQIIAWGNNTSGQTNVPSYTHTFLGTVKTNVSSSFGTNIITYNATNTLGFTANVTRTIIIQDPLAFSLVNSNVLFVPSAAPYTEPGVIANSTCLGDISGNVIVTGTVDTSTPGSYLLNYTVTNSVGLTFNLQRSVIVDHPTPPVLSLQLPPGSSPTIQFAGTLGLSYTLQTSTDLYNWTPLTNVLASPGTNLSISTPLTDPATPHLFFRVTYP